MGCIICEQDTGDPCVPLCEAHMGLSELAGFVSVGAVSDWPYTEPTHDDYMCLEELTQAPYLMVRWQDFLTSLNKRKFGSS